MSDAAQFSDGQAVSEAEFSTLAKFAPTGTLDVFASDQHGSYKKLLKSFFDKAGIKRDPGDEEVGEICTRFGERLGRAPESAKPAAALFNHLAFGRPDFRKKLTAEVMLVGRLEDTVAEEVDGGKGQLARLAVQPEDVADQVDGFKTLVKLNPDHPDSWKQNRDWLQDVYERAQKLGKSLFNETLLLQQPGESKVEMARKLPDAVIRMAEDFGPLGTFYKTQIPVLWMSDKGPIERVCTPDDIRDAAKAMDRIVPRPMLLLSAAVDFEQYVAQYAYVADVFTGPMCGRAYFKEAFADNISPEKSEDENWDALGDNFTRIALPRIHIIKRLCEVVSRPWWHKFKSMTDAAKAKIKIDAKPVARGVDASSGSAKES